MLPQSFARQYVEVDASRSFGKYGTGQGNVPLQYKGVVGACLLRKLAQGHGTCDVGGTAVVLAPGIDEVESFGLQFHIAFFIYTVMYNGAVPGIAGNGAEGFADESGLGSAERLEFLGCRQFGDFFFAHMVFEPF